MSSRFPLSYECDPLNQMQLLPKINIPVINLSTMGLWKVGVQFIFYHLQTSFHSTGSSKHRHKSQGGHQLHLIHSFKDMLFIQFSFHHICTFFLWTALNSWSCVGLPLVLLPAVPIRPSSALTVWQIEEWALWIAVPYWAFSARAAAVACSFSLCTSSLHRAFFSMFWLVRDSCLPAAWRRSVKQITCHTQELSGLYDLIGALFWQH